MATVTINNSEQRLIDQRMVTSELINNGLLGAGKQLIKGVQKSAARFKAGATGMKAGAGVGKKALGSKSYGAGRSVRKAGVMGKRMGQKAGRFAQANPKTTVAAAGIGGAAVGSMIPRRKK